MRSLIFFQPSSLSSRAPARRTSRSRILSVLLPRHRQQPVEIVARTVDSADMGRHVFQPLQRPSPSRARPASSERFRCASSARRSRSSRRAQLLLDGLDLLVEIVVSSAAFSICRFTRPSMMRSTLELLLDFDIERFGHPRQAVDRIEDFEQLLLFFDGGAGDWPPRLLSSLPRSSTDRRDHRFIISCSSSSFTYCSNRPVTRLMSASSWGPVSTLYAEVKRPRQNPSSSFARDHFAPFDALHQDFDVAVRQFQALDNVDDRAYREDLVGLRFVNRRIVLGQREDFLCPRPSLFPRARTLDSRPTTKVFIMYGKMTTSRIGIIGRRFVGFFLEVISCSPGRFTLVPKYIYTEASSSPSTPVGRLTRPSGVRVIFCASASSLVTWNSRPSCQRRDRSDRASGLRSSSQPPPPCAPWPGRRSPRERRR